MYIPSHLQVEIVNRFCDARCPMCTIKFVPDWSKQSVDEFSYKGVSRPAEIMTLETFKAITSKFEPYVDNIRFLSLHGCGESLLDKRLPEKVKFAKDLGFKEVGFTSNCNALTKNMAERLLDAGLNCIIPSIDGLTAEVHETIRPGTRFSNTIDNLRYFIQYRDTHDLNCKVLIRMVRQQLNISQWDDFNIFWRGLLDPTKGDDVLGIDVHNTGGKVPNYESMRIKNSSVDRLDYEDNYIDSISDGSLTRLVKPSPVTGQTCVKASEIEQFGGCPDLFTRMSIFVSGEVALCSADQAGFFPMGNVVDEDPISIFNNEHFNRYREGWLNNSCRELEHCKTCTVVSSRYAKTYVS